MATVKFSFRTCEPIHTLQTFRLAVFASASQWQRCSNHLVRLAEAIYRIMILDCFVLRGNHLNAKILQAVLAKTDTLEQVRCIHLLQCKGTLNTCLDIAH